MDTAAATAAEREAGTVVAVTGLAFEARIAAGPGVSAVAGGGDRVRLEAVLELAFARGALALVSFGLAGGLDDAAIPGTFVIAEAVVTPSGRILADAAWSAQLAQKLPGALRGDIAGVDTIVATPAEKRALRQSIGACAIDMESHVVAAFAAAHGVPFAVLRVIADPVHRALAPAATQGMRPDGAVDRLAVLSSLLRNPGQVPALTRTALDARAAHRALSRGRRLLGPGLDYPDLR